MITHLPTAPQTVEKLKHGGITKTGGVLIWKVGGQLLQLMGHRLSEN